MSNRPPKINPTGTTYSMVLVHPMLPHSDTIVNVSTTTREFDNMMKVVGEYIRADYEVKMNIYTADEITKLQMYNKANSWWPRPGQKYAFATCKPPLFAEG